MYLLDLKNKNKIEEFLFSVKGSGAGLNKEQLKAIVEISKKAGIEEAKIKPFEQFHDMLVNLEIETIEKDLNNILISYQNGEELDKAELKKHVIKVTLKMRELYGDSEPSPFVWECEEIIEELELVKHKAIFSRLMREY